MAHRIGPRFLCTYSKYIHRATALTATAYSSNIHPLLQAESNRTSPIIRDIRISAKATKPQHSAHLKETTETITDEWSNAKPFSQIPKASTLDATLKTLKTLFQGRENTHWEVLADFEKFGPIYKLNFGTLSLIFIKDIKAIEKLFRKDGKYPRRILLAPWREWRQRKGHSLSFLTGDGEIWKRQRTVVDKQMMPPNIVANYTDNFNDVVTDMIKRIRQLRERHAYNNTVPNFDQELFNWSLETIGTVLYDTRFGGLTDDRKPEMQVFIEAVQTMFDTTENLALFPRWFNRIFIPRKLHDFEKSWDIIFSVGTKLIDQKIKELEESIKGGKEVSGFIASLLASDKMSTEEIYASVAELMGAAVDTTSNTMQWVIECISRNPDVQEQLHAEVTSIVPDGSVPNYDHLQQMPYLKGIIKEVLRLYTVATSIVRRLNEDLVLCGYQIPAQTYVLVSTFGTGRDEKFFDDPEAFKPERWIRGHPENEKNTHSFASLPFGYGIRMCIGRRLAELEMYLLTARLSQQFKMVPAESKPLRSIHRALLVPEKSVNVQFIDRH